MTRWFCSALVVFGLACGSSAEDVSERTVEVGCGSCQLQATDHPGCYWAARIDGRVVPMSGPGKPGDGDAHGPDGMCNVTRTAVVSGKLYETHLFVTEVDLGPVDPTRRTQAHDHAH